MAPENQKIVLKKRDLGPVVYYKRDKQDLSTAIEASLKYEPYCTTICIKAQGTGEFVCASHFGPRNIGTRIITPIPELDALAMADRHGVCFSGIAQIDTFEARGPKGELISTFTRLVHNQYS